ncbi:hypothetical protein [Paenibacillus lemnae]|nr:hypothetical protein [Paenibacillus lemnae]
MQNILEQIPAGTRITLGTVDNTSGNLQNVDFESVSDYIAIVLEGANRIAVPVCKVTGISGERL